MIKVGDRIRIKPYDEVKEYIIEDDCGGMHMTYDLYEDLRHMIEYCDQILTVSEIKLHPFVDLNVYTTIIDSKRLSWLPMWFNLYNGDSDEN